MTRQKSQCHHSTAHRKNTTPPAMKMPYAYASIVLTTSTGGNILLKPDTQHTHTPRAWCPSYRHNFSQTPLAQCGCKYTQTSCCSRQSAIHNAHHILLHSSLPSGPMYSLLTHVIAPPQILPQPVVMKFEMAFGITHGASIIVAQMILPQVHLQKPCYDFSFLFQR